MRSKNNKIQKNPVLNGIFLCLPYLFLTLALYFGLRAGLTVTINSSPFLRTLVDQPEVVTTAVGDDVLFTVPVTEPVQTAETEETTAGTDPAPVTEPPVTELWKPEVYIYPKDIRYGVVWAYLTVDGWWNSEIPVYSCDDSAYLNKGAGHWQGSRYPGQNGRVVISAHVIKTFFDLETTEVGTKVSLKTSYGLYEYEVSEVVVFEETDTSYVERADGEDTLVLYTCYPRSVGVRRTTKRCALICKMTYGEALQ